MRPQDWERMSWHAKQRYLRRTQPRPPDNPRDLQPPKTRWTRKRLLESITRCSQCGAWFIETCRTPHEARYAC